MSHPNEKASVRSRPTNFRCVFICKTKRNKLNDSVIWLNDMATAANTPTRDPWIRMFVENHITPTRQLQFAFTFNAVFITEKLLCYLRICDVPFTTAQGKNTHILLNDLFGVFTSHRMLKSLIQSQSFSLTIVLSLAASKTNGPNSLTVFTLSVIFLALEGCIYRDEELTKTHFNMAKWIGPLFHGVKLWDSNTFLKCKVH